MRIFNHPIKKLTLAAAFAGGYVLGAKAGRARYEQILQVVDQVKEDPRVKDAAARAEDVLREAGIKQDPVPRGMHPLLKDEHIDTHDEVVYSTGPDIEETIDELADVDHAEQLIGQHRDNS
ncbi:hypothetical protein [Aeromicrobium sp. P5_D10]